MLVLLYNDNTSIYIFRGSLFVCGISYTLFLLSRGAHPSTRASAATSMLPLDEIERQVGFRKDYFWKVGDRRVAKHVTGVCSGESE